MPNKYAESLRNKKVFKRGCVQKAFCHHDDCWWRGTEEERGETYMYDIDNGSFDSTEEILTYIPVCGMMDYDVGSKEIEEDIKVNRFDTIPCPPSFTKTHSIASLNTLAKSLEKKATKVRQEVLMKRNAITRMNKAVTSLCNLINQLHEANKEIDKSYTHRLDALYYKR